MSPNFVAIQSSNIEAIGVGADEFDSRLGTHIEDYNWSLARLYENHERALDSDHKLPPDLRRAPEEVDRSREWGMPVSLLDVAVQLQSWVDEIVANGEVQGVGGKVRTLVLSHDRVYPPWGVAKEPDGKWRAVTPIQALHLSDKFSPGDTDS